MPTADSRSIFIYPPTPQQFHENDQKKYKKKKIIKGKVRKNLVTL